MPEGHTIHRLALDHRRDLVGPPLAITSPQGRAGVAAERLDGRALVGIDPHGKHLFYRFERGETLHVHLGLYGRFRRFAVPGPVPRPTVRLRLRGAEWLVDLIGPTVCSLVDPAAEAAIRLRLGPDPLRRDADPEEAWRRLRRRRISIGAALLDQRILAGVGNVFRAEALFVCGIDPRRPCPAITRADFDAIWTTVEAMLRLGVKDRRIVTVDPKELGVPRSRIPAHSARYVYRRPECLRCGAPVERFMLAARWAYRCPACQPG